MKRSILLLIFVQLTTWTQVFPNRAFDPDSQCELCNGGVTLECGKYYATTEECTARLPNPISLFSKDPIDPNMYTATCRPNKVLETAARDLVNELQRVPFCPRLTPRFRESHERNPRQVGSMWCFPIRSLDPNGYARMCTECSITTQFNGAFLSEVICKPGGEKCLLCQGQCTQNSVEVLVNGLSYTWRTGCCCGLYPDQFINKYFNWPCP